MNDWIGNQLVDVIASKVRQDVLEKFLVSSFFFNCAMLQMKVAYCGVKWQKGSLVYSGR